MMISARSLTASAALGLALLCSPRAAHADEPATPAATAPAAPATAAAPPAAAPAPNGVADAPPDTQSHHTAGPWILLGGGVALVISAAVLGALTVSEDDKREKEETKLVVLQPGDPQRAPLEQSIADHNDKAGTTRTASIICGTVGFLSIAGSIVWWFAEGGSSSPKAAAAPATKPSFTPSFGPGYAGANLALRF